MHIQFMMWFWRVDCHTMRCRCVGVKNVRAHIIISNMNEYKYIIATTLIQMFQRKLKHFMDSKVKFYYLFHIRFYSLVKAINSFFQVKTWLFQAVHLSTTRDLEV